MTDARRAAIAASEARHGLRRDRSRAACRIVLGRAARLQPATRTVELFTDEKSTYAGLAAKVFRADASGPLATGTLATGTLATGTLATGTLATGTLATGTLATGTLATGTLATGNLATGAPAVEPRSLVHLRTKSVEPRTTRNPLFPINSEEADMRDKLGRLRRESWLVSKMCKYLNLHLALYSAWRNWARPRFNRDRETPGQLMGLAERPLRAAELIGWRQDWGALSPCPFGCGSHAPRA
jgi:hypothetical protein